jgi:hypothetical protein
VFEGIAHKQPCDVPITEESSKMKVALLLAKAGKTVVLRDRPHTISDPVTPQRQDKRSL